MRATAVTGAVASHGEGPIWWNGLHWVDMLAGDVLSLTADGGVYRRHVSTVVAALRPRSSEGFVYAVERGFAVDDLAAPGGVRHLPQVWTDPAVRMNEGSCDARGRFYCGSMAYDQSGGKAAMYRLDPNENVTQVMTGLTVSNGLAWSPDGARAYYVDSATGRVDQFDDDPAHGLTNRRPLTTVSRGVPDGITVDAEGGVWVALWAGSAVHRYSPDGTLTAVIELTAHNVTACTFGGDDLRTLYITTSRQGAHGSDPQGGATFSVNPGVRGLPLQPFAG